MPWLAVVLLTTFLIVVFPLRALILTGRLGASARPDRGAHRPRSWRLADMLFLSGFGMLLAGTALVGLGVVDPLVDPATAQVLLGVLTLLAMTGLAVWTQETMGQAWRTDIPPIDDGQLVTDGPFRVVRNPSYVAMLGAGFGSVLLAPDPLTLAGWAVLLASLMLTARVEEPPLLARFGDDYRDYAEHVGRFLPGIGQLRR